MTTPETTLLTELLRQSNETAKAVASMETLLAEVHSRTAEVPLIISDTERVRRETRLQWVALVILGASVAGPVVASLL